MSSLFARFILNFYYLQKQFGTDTLRVSFPISHSLLNQALASNIKPFPPHSSNVTVDFSKVWSCRSCSKPGSLLLWWAAWQCRAFAKPNFWFLLLFTANTNIFLRKITNLIYIIQYFPVLCTHTLMNLYAKVQHLLPCPRHFPFLFH